MNSNYCYKCYRPMILCQPCGRMFCPAHGGTLVLIRSRVSEVNIRDLGTNYKLAYVSTVRKEVWDYPNWAGECGAHVCDDCWGEL